MPLSQIEKKSLFDKFKVAKLLNPEHYTKGYLRFRNFEEQDLAVSMEIKNDEVQIEYFSKILDQGYFKIENESDIQGNGNALKKHLKLLLIQKSNLFKMLKFINSDLIAIENCALIPRDLAIKADGELTGILPNEEFDPILNQFVCDPKFRFKTLVEKALYQTLSSYDLVENLESKKYLIEFGRKNFRDYLQHLLELTIIDSNDIKQNENFFASNNIFEAMTSPAFFHKFLLNLNQIRVIAASIERDSGDCLLKLPEEIFEKTATTNFAQKILEGKIATFNPENFEGLKTLIEYRFREDFAGVELVGGLEIFYSETIGTNFYRNQEDAFLLGESIEPENPQHFAAMMQEEICKLGFKIRQAQETSESYAGSTAIVANYSRDQVLTLANCGDSRATLLFFKPGFIADFKILTIDHEPQNILEKALVEKAGGVVTNNRVQRDKGSLAMSRSFGDSRYQNSGNYFIKFEPEIFQYNISDILKNVNQGLDEGQTVEIFLMVSCDGLFTPIPGRDSEKISEKFYLKALVDWHKNHNGEKEKWRENIASYIQDNALAFGSTDNITLCFANITKAPESAVTIAVCDGHSGKEVSHTLVKELEKSLLKENGKKLIYPRDAKSIIEDQRAFIEYNQSASAEAEAPDDSWEIEIPDSIRSAIDDLLEEDKIPSATAKYAHIEESRAEKAVSQKITKITLEENFKVTKEISKNKPTVESLNIPASDLSAEAKEFIPTSFISDEVVKTLSPEEYLWGKNPLDQALEDLRAPSTSAQKQDISKLIAPPNSLRKDGRGK